MIYKIISVLMVILYIVILMIGFDMIYQKGIEYGKKIGIGIGYKECQLNKYVPPSIGISKEKHKRKDPKLKEKISG
jgi:hypothetical protein